MNATAFAICTWKVEECIYFFIRKVRNHDDLDLAFTTASAASVASEAAISSHFSLFGLVIINVNVSSAAQEMIFWDLVIETLISIEALYTPVLS